MNRILIIESHGDDALISAFSALSLPVKKDIITVLKSRNSDALRNFFQIEGVTDLNIPDYEYKSRPYSHVDVRRWVKEGRNPWDEASIRDHDLPEFYEHIAALAPILASSIKNYDAVFLPAGIGHSGHALVHESCKLAISLVEHDPLVVYYTECPYSNKKYGEALVKGWQDSNKGLSSLLIRHSADQYSMKEKVYSNVYPSEVSL